MVGGLYAETRKGFDGPGNIEQCRVGVDVHREFDGAVAHCGYCHPGCDSRPGQICAERMPQGVDIDHPALLISLGNIGCRKVAVENADHILGHRKQTCIVANRPLASTGTKGFDVLA